MGHSGTLQAENTRAVTWSPQWAISGRMEPSSPADVPNSDDTSLRHPSEDDRTYVHLGNKAVGHGDKAIDMS
ncbi:Hypp7297 [Branchiostoma lanceolatum]|uniref:Hypp7297 protein n=1 Tax=Branchiostoma lanceolatum TaxID=7740 RepID=A0A8K0E844_BRALA|nr:Hypp7297 [Branchiostoma lanceolatum]